MGNTPQERTRRRWLWRQLVNASMALDAGTIKDDLGDYLSWSSCLESKAQSFALFGMARLAKAYVAGSITERVQLAPALQAAAQTCARFLDAAPIPVPPPRLPTPAAPSVHRHRADLDGPYEADED
jgi:hypothetical protein